MTKPAPPPDPQPSASLRASLFRRLFRRDAVPLVDVQDWNPSEKPIWIHGASAGELESVRTVVFELLKKGEWILVTSMSRSGVGVLQEWERQARAIESSDRLRVALSPVEGEWAQAFRQIKPKSWITVKYEAWPDLLRELSRQAIPIFVVNMRVGASWIWARRLLAKADWDALRWRATFSDEQDHQEFLKFFFRKRTLAEANRFQNDQRFVVLGDPRWDRMMSVRDEEIPASLRPLAAAVAQLPRPLWVLGSAWPEDMDRLLPVFEQGGIRGTVLIFPHQLHPEFLRVLKSRVGSASSGWAEWTAAQCPFIWDTSIHKDGRPPVRFVLVREPRVLKYFYRFADWVTLGGGFSHGVHSVIEPAVYQKQISAGPKRADQFPEVRFLVSRGQVSICNTSSEFQKWCEQRNQEWDQLARTPLATIEQKTNALTQVLGATARIIKFYQSGDSAL